MASLISNGQTNLSSHSLFISLVSTFQALSSRLSPHFPKHIWLSLISLSLCLSTFQSLSSLLTSPNPSYYHLLLICHQSSPHRLTFFGSTWVKSQLSLSISAFRYRFFLFNLSYFLFWFWDMVLCSKFQII